MNLRPWSRSAHLKFVGILVHENPRLAQESRSTLEPGNVVTVEPGIYLPGKGGIRIEDLVVVTDGEPGCDPVLEGTATLG